MFFFLMIRRPPRSTQGVSSAASDVYKRQVSTQSTWENIMGICANAKDVDEGQEIIKDDGQTLVRESAGRKRDKNKSILVGICLLYTSPSPRDLSTSRMPSSA
eukprot:TRINITY_DN7394_c0_g1_i2.p2 TRINITY_DN7394_c0_g1~~TRINITY_DN7394_c0_g1_i2.p2  ORF type:complete len:103 (+),score=35.29 TRINITY_DN7394_c0_g1_i2:65-373(+)